MTTQSATSPTWFRTVGFGGCPAPHGPWSNPADAYAALERWFARKGADAGTLANAHTIRVSEYATRAQARAGDISDGRGDGLLASHGIHDWMADHCGYAWNQQ